MIHDWSSAYLHQAFSDYRMFRLIEEMDGVDDQKIYFLLKVGEKAAQSYFTDGKQPPTMDHMALIKFFKAVRTDPILQIRVSIKLNYNEFIKKVKKLEGYARELHRLVAVNPQTPNCEYPWEDARGIQVPSETTFSVMGTDKAPLLRKYIGLFEMWFEKSGLPVT